MFGFLKRKIFTQKYLAKKSAVKHKKDWVALLQRLGDAASKSAEKGDSFIVFPWTLIKIKHNMNRNQKDVVDDIKKKFKGCHISFDSDLNGQTICKISW